MTVQRMIELLKIEHECMLRGAHDDCDRDCANCELVQDDSELHEMYTSVITLLKEQEAEWLEVDDKHDAFDCSRCGAMVGRKCLYCPGCGARMKNGTRAMG